MKRGVQGNTAFLAAAMIPQQWIIGHLYIFKAASGDLDYFTDLDVDITYAGNTYKSGSIRLEGMRMKVAVGVSVDEQEVTAWAAPTDTLFGTAFLQGLSEGLMDGGMITRLRAVWPIQTGDVSVDVLAPPVVWQMFTGYMSTIEAIGRVSAKFKVKSPLVKLNMNMPKNFYQPQCGWSLFDDSLVTGVAGVGCTLLASDYAVSGTVLTATAEAIQVSGGISPATGPDGYPYFQRGKLVFTSGSNDGLLTTIDSNDGANIFFAYPLDIVPTVGDTFTYYPGCSKSELTCNLKFSNVRNRRGFDRVPPVTVSL